MNENEIMRKRFFEGDVISRLELLDVDTGERRVLKEFDRTVEAPNFLKDGSGLLFNSMGKMYRFDMSSGEVSQVYTGECVMCNNDHVLSFDGKYLAVSHQTKTDMLSRIYILPATGGEPRLVTDNAPSYLHGWSPDGTTLAYCADRAGNFDVYTVSVDGGAEKRLTDAPGLDDGPEYTPDGKYIWFNSVRTGLMQLWRMKTDGSEQQQMTFDRANSWFAHISPDGRRVAYIAYREGDVDPGDHPPAKNVELRLMSAEGGEFRTIAELFGGQGTLNVNSWAPDNKHIAFVSYEF